MSQETGRINELEARLELAEVALKRRDEELAALTRLLEEKDRQLEALPSKPGRQLKAHTAEVTASSLAAARKKRFSRKHIKTLRASEWFDADWYLKQYQDLLQSRWATKNPAEHYLRYGAFENRDPSPRFRSQWYLDRNPDVLASGVNPLVHYLEFGQWEGRLPIPTEPQS